MKYNKLGNTGLEVSQLGFGAWGIGGDAYGPVDKNVAITALHFAADQGINFYDTSDLYGSGRSEEILGEAFENRRDKVILATKFGMLPHSGRALPTDFSIGNIRQSLEKSLKRLRSDYIDLYQFHSPTIDTFENAEIFDFLETLKKEGKIRAYGGSMRSPADAKTAIEKYGLKSTQVNFNLIDHRAVESGLTKTAQENHAGVIARTPLGFGFLTGTLTEKDLNFGEKDHRRFYPREQLERWLQAPKLFDKFYAERNTVSFALRFCMDTPGITTVIPGMSNKDEVIKNLQSLKTAPLKAAEFTEIEQIYRDKLFFDPKLSYRPSKQAP
jgi:aryl-alcohol dehydrogenase-like predicted oxidoreductase